MPRSMVSGRDSPHQRLIALQKKIYLSLQDDCQSLMGESPLAIRKYEAAYKKDFRSLSQQTKTSSLRSLTQEVCNREVTLIGDFHTFYQAQRTALRILRAAMESHGGKTKKWILGLELVPSHHQKELDRYISGRSSLKTLLKAIDYDHQWGFPWANYAQLLEWARSKKLQLVALNRPKELIRLDLNGNERDLALRDEWAAGIITDRLAFAGKNARMVVLYGELHLGKTHLPQALEKVSRSYLKRTLSTVVIHQNQDELYWKLARQRRELKTQIVKMRDPHTFCVISTTPWLKLRSLISWLETWKNSDTSIESPEILLPPGQDFDFQVDDDHSSVDYLDLVRSDSQVISHFLDRYPASLDGLTVRTWEDLDYFANPKLKRMLSPRWRRALAFHLSKNLRLYIPSPQIAYLAASGDNATAEIAALHIFHQRYPPSGSFPPLEEFSERILANTFGFFGSLILNPRRKCDLIEDHHHRIHEINRGVRETFRGEKRARVLAIEAFECLRRKGNLKSAQSRILKNHPDVGVYWTAARYLGSIYGRALYFATLLGGPSRVSLDEVKELFLAPRTVSPNFFREKLEQLVLRLPALAQVTRESKRESL